MKGSSSVTLPQNLGNVDDIKCENIYADGSAFILYDFISSEACDTIIEQAKQLNLRSCGYPEEIRIVDRVEITSESLSETLFERLEPFVGTFTLTAEGVVPPQRGITESEEKRQLGNWRPIKINENQRICRYKQGGFFAPHYDYGIRNSSKECSFKTIMLYLNDSFEDGCTHFFNETQEHYSKPDSSKIQYSFKPKKGSCIIFNSAITHSGQPLKSGEKWILRSEVIFMHSHTKRQLLIALGTGSEIKIRAVEKYFEGSKVISCSTVESGVKSQPIGAQETAKGAKNRALAALDEQPNVDIAIGIENGMIWERNGKPMDVDSISIFSATSGKEDVELVDRACIVIVKRPQTADQQPAIKYCWSKSITIPPLESRPFKGGPNGEWSELKDPHSILTKGRKSREDFLFEAIERANPFSWV